MAEPYANSGAQREVSRIMGAALGADARAVPEMEQLGATLAQLASRLASTNDVMQNRVQHFLEDYGKEANTGASPIPPEPQPGSLSALKFFAAKIDGEIARFETLSVSLGKIP